VNTKSANRTSRRQEGTRRATNGRTSLFYRDPAFARYRRLSTDEISLSSGTSAERFIRDESFPCPALLVYRIPELQWQPNYSWLDNWSPPLRKNLARRNSFRRMNRKLRRLKRDSPTCGRLTRLEATGLRVGRLGDN